MSTLDGEGVVVGIDKLLLCTTLNHPQHIGAIYAR